MRKGKKDLLGISKKRFSRVGAQSGKKDYKTGKKKKRKHILIWGKQNRKPVPEIEEKGEGVSRG